MTKTGRNDPCPCGSGRKYKHCCSQREESNPAQAISFDDAMRTALAHERAGRLVEAEAVYRQVLERAPAHADALNNLGALNQRRGHLDAAIACYRSALSARPRAADLHFNLGSALAANGQLAEAIASYRHALSLRPDHAMARNNLGNALCVAGDFDAAIGVYRGAVAANPGHVDAHYNLGLALQARGRPADAVEHYRKAVALRPDHVAAFHNLGNALVEQRRLDEAAACYSRAIELRPDYADAHNNLGNVLQLAGNLRAAVECYRAALAHRPGDARAYNNLGNALNEAGDIEGALTSYRSALEVGETPEFRANFALCIGNAEAEQIRDPALRQLLIRALCEPWTRPSNLAKVGARVVSATPGIRECIERAMASWPARLSPVDLYGADGVAVLARDPLLSELLASAQVCDVALERCLTLVRRALLVEGAQTDPSDAQDETVVAFHCALARQCFIDEFVFACDEHELHVAAQCVARIEAALESGASIAPRWIAAAGTYFPLFSLRNVASLLERTWPEAVEALLQQQICEPMDERRRRDHVARLTAVDDAVSSLVRDQYEEHPYPRWMRLAPPGETRSLNGYLRERFPCATFRPLDRGDAPEILIAGCGTGQEPIETAQLFPQARVLAVDLSLSSLAYAKRKSEEVGVTGIEYAQADILQLGSIARTFDVISSVGVLHHLEHPAAGLEALLPLLRPHGFMRIGLYSERARGDVVAARRFIAQRGYAASADGIRRCRQDLIDNANDFGRLLTFRDFYATSGCRDLLFHVQEHRFNLPQIAELLRRFDLRFIGFVLEPHIVRAYRERSPEDIERTNLDRWNEFENAFPDTFSGMYMFWVQKAP